jgi:hypothetical protein
VRLRSKRERVVARDLELVPWTCGSAWRQDKSSSQLYERKHETLRNAFLLRQFENFVSKSTYQRIGVHQQWWGGNWGGKGSFHQVDSFDDAVESLAAAEEVGEMEEEEDDMPELEWHIDTEYDSMPELENEVEEFEELQFVLE